MPLNCVVGQEAIIIVQEVCQVFGGGFDGVCEYESRTIWVLVRARMGIEYDEEFGGDIGETETRDNFWRASYDNAS